MLENLASPILAIGLVMFVLYFVFKKFKTIPYLDAIIWQGDLIKREHNPILYPLILYFMLVFSIVFIIFGLLVMFVL